MKKAYVKPALYAERFSLSEHIANCYNIVHFGPECGPYNINGEMIFNSSACGSESDDWWKFYEVEGEENMTFEMLRDVGVECYNTSVSLSTIFQS